MAEGTNRVLLIEHEAGYAHYLGEVLSQARDPGLEVVTASSLRAGLGFLKESAFDVILLELAVPDGAGLGNLAVLRAVAPRTPVIVLGSSEDETIALEALSSGARDYVVKHQITGPWLERSIRYAVERHRMDQALLEAEERYHSIFDHLVEGIFQTTPEGRYLMANAALARIYGYASPEELVASLTDIRSKLYVEPGRRDEFVRLMQEQEALTGFESQVYRKDGSIIWISENCRAIRDETGRLLYYEGTVEDITQRREAEERLRESEVLYHSLVENLPQNIFRKDLAGRFTFANQQFCRMLGRPLEEIVGKTDYDFFPPELAAKYQQDDRQVIATGQPYETVEEHQPLGREKVYVQVVKTPLRSPDGKTVVGLQAIFWDITRQRLAEEELRRANAELARSRQELHARNQRMEEDLHMAREFQLKMLPQTYPVFPCPGSDGSAFSFTHRYLPTGSVGGDFFTLSALSETQASVFFCDVAGHGVQAALVTSMIRALLEELKSLAGQPGAFLTKLNSDLRAILQHAGAPLLTTAFYFVADWATGVLQYANAGHLRPFHLRRSAGQVVPLSNAFGYSQPPLGLLGDTVYLSSEAILSPGDGVLLFTDGLVDVENPQGQFFTEQMLASAIESALSLHSSALLDKLLEQTRVFGGDQPYQDDVCLVAMDYHGCGG